jgi:DNA topoisomerase-2
MSSGESLKRENLGALLPTPGDDRASKYTKLDPVQHVRERPGMYVGSVVPEQRLFVIASVSDTGIYFRKANVEMVPALYKLFDEVLSNALDASVRDASVKNIKITIADDFINVRNDGCGIPVVQHEEHKCYVPELIFGHLHTGENFNDEDRLVAGQNGLGVKLCNIFSNKFVINVRDALTGSVFYAEWLDGMTRMTPPKIKMKSAPSTGFVDVLFHPDDAMLAPSGAISCDVRQLFARRTLDVALAARDGVSIQFNDVKIPRMTLKKYVQLFSGEEKFIGVDESADAHWRVGLALSSEPRVVGLVNGVSAVGVFVEYVEKRLYSAVVEAVKRKREYKDVDLKAATIRARVVLFVVATVNKPTFNSQTKHYCDSYERLSTYTPSDAFVKKIVASSAIVSAVEAEKAKLEKKVSKATDGKKTTHVNVPKLQDAIKAGGAQSKLCSLVITEGDSAMAFAKAGLAALGHDLFGVWPLKGKMLNVREATSKQLMENVEIKNLKTILGLRSGETHDHGYGLRYGRLIVLADSDADGSHIRGLVLNFIHWGWPALLKSGFVCVMHTPIARATKGVAVHDFLSLSQMDTFLATPLSKGFKVKYYKGLGTWSSASAKLLMSASRPVVFVGDANTDTSLELAFSKAKADDRKQWILAATTQAPSIDYTAARIGISDFVNKDLVNHGVYNVERTIPSIVDGLKTGQRKILFTVFKRNYIDAQTEVKVAQLSGAVSELTMYLHGEDSLNGAIVKLAQTYVGSNNVNLLVPNGQFGTRLATGDDAASPRYIYTCASPAARLLFRPEDDALLARKSEEGVLVEPVVFWPVLPTILINGAAAVATGFSCNVPLFNPRDVLSNVRNFLGGKPFSDMTPFYKGFKGAVEDAGDGRWLTKGVVTSTAVPGVVVVTELPIDRSFNAFADWCNEDKSPVKVVENRSTDVDCNFKLCFKDMELYEKSKHKLHDVLKLVSYVSFKNVHLFSADAGIRKYASAHEVLAEWCAFRLAKYEVRRTAQLEALERDIEQLTSKARFVHAVATKQLVLGDFSTSELEAYLGAQAYPRISDSHNYLMNILARAFTTDNVTKLLAQVAEKQVWLDTLKNKTAQNLWEADLAQLEASL